MKIEGITAVRLDEDELHKAIQQVDHLRVGIRGIRVRSTPVFVCENSLSSVGQRVWKW